MRTKANKADKTAYKTHAYNQGRSRADTIKTYVDMPKAKIISLWF